MVHILLGYVGMSRQRLARLRARPPRPARVGHWGEFEPPTREAHLPG